MNGTGAGGVTVIGGGLVGSLWAVYLRRRGVPVEVLEKRPDPRRAGAEGGRSINLVLTFRGLQALRRVGLAERALALTVPVRGRRIHDTQGRTTFQPYGIHAHECNYSVSRAGLNQLLLEAAGQAGARLRFEEEVRGLEVTGDGVALRGSGSRSQFTTRAYGADGAGSVVRRSLVHATGGAEEVAMLDHGYKELRISAGPDGSHRLDPHALHLWPRRERMLMALANRDGSFTATLYLPLEGEGSFGSLDSAEAVRKLFQTEFPDALPLIPDLEAAFFANPTGELGTVRCRPWSWGGRVLLLGDAAHAIVPFFGQGMNAGFEDCRILDDLFRDTPPGDLDAVFEAYESRRRPDTDAIADMALENFDEMRAHVADPGFRLRKEVEQRIERAMPHLYRSRYAMVMYTEIPFSVAREAGRIQQGILDEVCAGLAEAEDLDLHRARRLVEERLTPFLRERGVRLPRPDGREG